MKYILLCTAVSCLFFKASCMDAPKVPNILQENKTLKKTHANKNVLAQALYSPNGKYFIENISTQKNESQITLWDASNLTPTISFSEWSNRPIFDPLSNYVVFFSKIRLRDSYPIASLYSITHNTKTPLYKNQNNNIIFKNIKLDLSANGEYIMYNFLRDEQYTNIKKLIKYNRATGTLDDVSIDSWNIGSQCHFGSNFSHPDDAQSIIYLDPSYELITKRNIDKNTLDITYKLKQSCQKMKLNGSLITIQYDNEIELFALECKDIKPIKTISYKESDIKVLNIKKQGLTIHQYDRTSFIVLDNNNNYKEKFFYTFDSKDFPRIEKIITNQTETHFLVLYKYSIDASPSSIVLFSLSPEGNIEPQLVKHFNEKITSIQFLYDNFLLIQGIKTRIIDLMGNKIETLGTSQSCAAHKNSVLQIYHATPFAFDRRTGGCYTIPMKSKLCLSLLNSEFLNK